MAHPIDLAAWPRRAHYEHFRAYAVPWFTVCVRAPVDGVWRQAREEGGSLFAHMLHGLAGAAQEEPALRLRLRADGVVEHPLVDPSFTARGPQGTFRFLITPWHAERARFVAELRARVAGWELAQAPLLDAPERDDLIWVSCLPGLDFTTLQPALRGAPLDSVPMVHWGRVVERGGAREVGLALTVHHALVDGAQVTAFLERVGQAWGEGVVG